jgi:phospholipid transport system substrate-binding protein
MALTNKIRNHCITCILVLFTLIINPLTLNASKNSAKNFVNEVTGKVTSILDNTNLGAAEKKQDLKNIFEKYVDIAWISKFTLGKYTRSASKEQIAEFNQLFTKYLTNSYVSNFSNFSSNDIIIDSVTQTNQHEFLVKTIVKNHTKNSSIAINFQLYEKAKENSFVVFDIIIEGVSMIATQRSEFSSIISQYGFDGMLNKLRQKKY